MKSTYFNCVLFLALCHPMNVFAEVTLEEIKSATKKEVITGCANGILEPNIKRFMEKAKAEGKPFKDEESAKRATLNPQFKAAVEKMRPNAEAMCLCFLDATIKKIESAKTQAEIDSVVKNMKPDQSVAEKCSNKFLPAFNKQSK